MVHHLAVDGVSWRILLEDLQTAYGQLARGQAVRLPPKTTSLQHWARRLVEYAQSDAMQEQKTYWRSVIAAAERTGGYAGVPVDLPDGENTEESAGSVASVLSARETRALLQEVPVAYRTEITDVLLTALAQAVSRWTGASATLVELEGHGREPLFDDVDLSRTVGWFTSLYPVVLDLSGVVSIDESGIAAVREFSLAGVESRGASDFVRALLDDDAETGQVETADTSPLT